MIRRTMARAALSALLLAGATFAAQAAGTFRMSVESNLNTLDPAKMKGGQ